MLQKLFEKAVNGGSLELSEALELIREAAIAINPSIPYNEDLTLSALQNGFADSILPGVLEAIASNPDKVGFQVTKLYSKPNLMAPGSGQILIKTYIKTIK